VYVNASEKKKKRDFAHLRDRWTQRKRARERGRERRGKERHKDVVLVVLVLRRRSLRDREE